MNPSEGNLPDKVARRLELFKMFYPLDRKYERRWAKIFKSDFDTIVAALGEAAAAEAYSQEAVNGHLILWRQSDSSAVECMFYFIDATDLQSVLNCFRQIEKYSAYLTYGIVHQKKDGENVYDIFRFSRFSYLEHCNRIKYPVSKAVK